MPGSAAERRAQKTLVQALQQRRPTPMPMPRPATSPVSFPTVADLSPLAAALTPAPVGETPEAAPAPAPASAEFSRRLDAELDKIMAADLPLAPPVDSPKPVGETLPGDLAAMVREETLDLLWTLVDRGLHAHHLTPALGAQLHACVRAALTGESHE